MGLCVEVFALIRDYGFGWRWIEAELCVSWTGL